LRRRSALRATTVSSWPPSRPAGKRHSFLELSLCLSRACLGKTIDVSIKLAHKGVCRTATTVSICLLSAAPAIACCLATEASAASIFVSAFAVSSCRNASFLEFSLCLSRACLGKMIIFSINGISKRHGSLQSRCSAESRSSMPASLQRLSMTPVCVPQAREKRPRFSTSHPLHLLVQSLSWQLIALQTGKTESEKKKGGRLLRTVAVACIAVSFSRSASSFLPAAAPLSAIPWGKTVLFPLCLSRVCLGKMIMYIYKWLKRTVLLPASDRSPSCCAQVLFTQHALRFQPPKRSLVPSLSW
jgi:hypothetical protein